MLKILKQNLFLFLLVVFAGCTLSPLSKTTVLPAITPEPTITQTFSPTVTKAVNLPTPTEITLPTQIAEKIYVQTFCPEIKEGLDGVETLPGILVFGAKNGLEVGDLLSPQEDYVPKLTFWNPQADLVSFYDLEGDELYYYFSESPDKEKLAFTEGKTIDMITDLFIVNHIGETVNTISFPEDWTFFSWLNNDQVLFRQFRMEEITSEEEYDLVAVDFLNKTQERLPSNFPEIYLRGKRLMWGSNTLFNQEKTFVFYPIWLSDQTMMASVLWNVVENREVTQILGSGPARWSPDGSFLLLTVSVGKDYFEHKDEIFVVKPDGEATRMTFFSEYYGLDDQYTFTLPVWSPDSRKIAFWVITKFPVETAQLAVLDLDTLAVDLFCHEINPYPYRFSWDMYSQLGEFVSLQVNSAPPIWSPDSRYLLIEDQQGYSNVLLLDTQNNTITQIAENARPVGWLTEPVPLANISEWYDNKTEVIDLIRNNGGSDLPAIWGFRPGISTGEDLKDILEQFDTVLEDDFTIVRNTFEGNPSLSIDLFENESRVSVNYSYERDGEFLKQIKLSFHSMNEYGTGANMVSFGAFGDSYFEEITEEFSVSKILSNYGNPTDILIYPIRLAPRALNRLSLLLVYQDDGLLLEYTFPFSINENSIIGKIDELGSIDIITWNPNKNHDLSLVIDNKSGLGVTSENYPLYQSIDQVSIYSVNEWVEILTNDTDDGKMISLSLDAWE